MPVRDESGVGRDGIESFDTVSAAPDFSISPVDETGRFLCGRTGGLYAARDYFAWEMWTRCEEGG